MSATTNHHPHLDSTELQSLAKKIRQWGQTLGFQQVGFTGTGLKKAEAQLDNWLKAGHHGEMTWMAQHGTKRSRPAELVPNTLRIISVRMDYLPESDVDSIQILHNPELGYISRYALGRDYHKLMRKRLQRLADHIEQAIGPFGYRVFVDSAPVLEKPLAQKAGLGWIGKHTNLLHRQAGSWFFLGELFTDLPLPADAANNEDHCGTCQACIEVCPTQAIIAPYQLDARRCISYLTIELKGSIPIEFRAAMGNRIYGCDDCQLLCPWNRFAQTTQESDYLPRHNLAAPKLVDLFNWDESMFLKYTEGSALRRLGHERWLRNIAVALGNAPKLPQVIDALQQRKDGSSPLVQEHILWALEQHGL